MADSKLVKDILKDIEKISEKLQLEPYQLSKAEFKEFRKFQNGIFVKWVGIKPF